MATGTISMADLKDLIEREKISPRQLFSDEEILGDEKIKSYVEQKKAEYQKKKDGSADFIPDIPGSEDTNSGGSEEGEKEAGFIPD
jgi:hypothetical protein